MANENRFYLTASELSDLMGISIGHAYKLIRDMNAELPKRVTLWLQAKCRSAMWKSAAMAIRRSEVVL